MTAGSDDRGKLRHLLEPQPRHFVPNGQNSMLLGCVICQSSRKELACILLVQLRFEAHHPHRHAWREMVGAGLLKLGGRADFRDAPGRQSVSHMSCRFILCGTARM